MAQTETVLYSQYFVPILLLIAWIVGCILTVYFVFS
ncbi:sarcoplasmic/endoplasmic reticulum calcium ATPase regulator DWORF [Sceloporus undulatus]|nr:sarcoplasmic/endoplasmic reticulum calcium ATPase regulator DWORF [Sceloporus undulatus]